MDNFGASRKSQHGLLEGIPASQTPEEDPVEFLPQTPEEESTPAALNWPSSGINNS